ncbi:hypothetical protein SLE2022_154790 [Rubroshorea leprosula]
MEYTTIISCPRCSKTVTVKKKSRSIYCSTCKSLVSLPDDCEQQLIQAPRPQQQQQRRHHIRCSVAHLINKMQGISISRDYSSTSAESLNFPVEFPLGRRSKKRAVLCGVSYKNWKYNLKGTVNDVKNIRDLLMSKYGYPKEYIRVLTEEEPDPRYIPAKANILSSLIWLVGDNKPGDSLVFFYSGHGLQQPDFENDEHDGLDETICPSDFWKEGMIVDNDLNSILVYPLKNDVKLHAIFDSCHSGTILDLPHMYDRKKKRWIDNKPPSGDYKGTVGGLAITISACTDGEKASDSTAFTGKMNGALTYPLVDLLKKFPGPTYGDLFDLIEDTFYKVNYQGGNILKKMFSSKLSQTPLLSSSEEFDPYKMHIEL